MFGFLTPTFCFCYDPQADLSVSPWAGNVAESIIYFIGVL